LVATLKRESRKRLLIEREFRDFLLCRVFDALAKVTCT